MIQSYVHELNNAANMTTLINAYMDASAGKMDEAGFVEKMLRVENDGTIAQITVALDLELKQTNSQEAVQLVKGFRSGKIKDESELKEKMYALTKEAELKDRPGVKAADYYKEKYQEIPKNQ